jgi:hypothetical protein
VLTSQYEIVEFLKKRVLVVLQIVLAKRLVLKKLMTSSVLKKQAKWLKPQQKKKLLELVREVTARLMSTDDSDFSADDTMSQGASTPLTHGQNHTFHCLARAYDHNEVSHKHMRRFIQDFYLV